MNTIPSI